MGNKCDLEDRREVTKEEGQELAKVFFFRISVTALQSLGIPFFETSARYNENITESIFELVRNIPREGLTYKLVIVVSFQLTLCLLLTVRNRVAVELERALLLLCLFKGTL